MKMQTGVDGFRSDIDKGPKNKIECLAGDVDEFCKTFVIHGEDHTMGNALKHALCQYPEVQFCGYTIPHPTENKIHLRIQSCNVPAMPLLRRALKQLIDRNSEILKAVQTEIKRAEEEDIVE